MLITREIPAHKNAHTGMFLTIARQFLCANRNFYFIFFSRYKKQLILNGPENTCLMIQKNNNNFDVTNSYNLLVINTIN